MHELSVTENILRISVEEAKKNNANKVTRINIKMGVLSDLLPECINDYFAVISQNTIAKDAKIIIEKLPMKVNCRECNNTSEIDIKSFRCPVCGSQNMKIVQGNEFYIDSLEVE